MEAIPLLASDKMLLPDARGLQVMHDGMTISRNPVFATRLV